MVEKILIHFDALKDYVRVKKADVSLFGKISKI